MTINYTSLLSLAEPVTGSQSGTWGDDVNKGITDYLDIAIAGTNTLSTDADVTLTLTSGSSAGNGITSSTAQYAILLLSGARTAARNVTVPASSRNYVVHNSTTGGYAVTVRGAGPTTGVSIANGEKAVISWNGSDYVKVASTAISNLTGILPVANGGTGLSSGTSGGIPYYSASGTIASSAALASNALVVGGGAGATPSTITTGTGVVTALGVNTGTAGSFVVNGGALGTPSSGTATNLTGLPISTGVSGLGTGVATFLATPSSANLASAVTDETGSGSLVFATSPTLVTPNLGTPSAAVLTNATGLPINSGVSGLGTGVATALAVTPGSAGAVLINGGVLGTPSSGTATNLTGLPISTGVSGLGTGVATALGNATNASGGITTPDGAATLTNKRIDPRVSSTTSASSLTPDISAYDQYCFTALAATLTINAPTGPPVNGDKLIFRILDNGTGQTLTWNGTYTQIGVILPPTTTANKMTYVGCIYNAANTRWDVVAVTTQA